MNKKDIKNILFSIRTNENEKIINNLLGKIDVMDEGTFQKIVQQIGGTEKDVKEFLEKKIQEKQNSNVDKHTPINEMFAYGIASNCIHLHLPTDLHQMISEKGIQGTIDTVNLHLLDAIEKIKNLRDNGYYKFQDKDSIYMISPVLMGRELKFLEGLNFETRTYKKKDLNSEEFIKNNPEAMLATHIFGKEKNVGSAKIKFDIIDSKEWQCKKQKTIEDFKNKGITLSKERDGEK